MTHVVHVIGGLGRGGAETALARLVTAAAARGQFRSTVVTLGPADDPVARELAIAGVEVFTVPLSRGPRGAAAIARLAALLARLRPSLIQGWMYHGNLAALLGRSAPVVWNIRNGAGGLRHERWTTRLAARACARLSRLPAAVVNNSRSSARQHELLLGLANPCAPVIPNGFDLDHFHPSADHRHSVRTELGLDPGAALVGLIARWHPLKDHAGFLHSAARIAPDTHFLLAGKWVEPSNPAIAAAVDRLRLSGRVHCLGERDDIPRLMAALDVAVSCSIDEGFPNVIGEAMSCGVPCAVTDVGDSAWLVGDTGVAVSPSDPPALAAAVNHLLSRRWLGRAARERIGEHFSLASVVSRYASLYESVVEKHAAVRQHPAGQESPHVRHRWIR